MFRGDGVICGTTTTGTGTLTLAATPVPPGGMDFDVWLRGVGFTNSAVVMVEYSIVEYTNTTFTTVVKQEGGIGTLTLGGSSGIANCTLARTTIDNTLTSLNSQPAAYSQDPGTSISIGTAANTLVMIAPRTRSALGSLPYTSSGSTTLSRDGVGLMNVTTTNGVSNFSPTNQMIYYIPFFSPCRMSVTRARVRVAATYNGQNNNVYAALYVPSSAGLPGKLLTDFGGMGTANSAFTSNGTIGSSALGQALILEPGFYIAALHAIWTAGGTGTPGLACTSSSVGLFSAQMFGTVNFTTINMLTTGSNASAAFADPAAAPTANIPNSQTILVAFGN